MCILGMFTTIGFAPPVHWFASLSPLQGGCAGAAPINLMENIPFIGTWSSGEKSYFEKS